MISCDIRSYGMCASGSCIESTLRVSGTFADSSPAFACAAMALYVDTSQPTTACPPRTDDCDNNGIPDPIDIANGTAQDQNYNAVIDQCEEGNAPIIPNTVLINPPTVTAGQPIHGHGHCSSSIRDADDPRYHERLCQWKSAQQR